jgi:hypothetical protein
MLKFLAQINASDVVANAKQQLHQQPEQRSAQTMQAPCVDTILTFALWINFSCSVCAAQPPDKRTAFGSHVRAADRPLLWGASSICTGLMGFPDKYCLNKFEQGRETHARCKPVERKQE